MGLPISHIVGFDGNTYDLAGGNKVHILSTSAITGDFTGDYKYIILANTDNTSVGDIIITSGNRLGYIDPERSFINSNTRFSAYTPMMFICGNVQKTMETADGETIMARNLIPMSTSNMSRANVSSSDSSLSKVLNRAGSLSTTYTTLSSYKSWIDVLSSNNIINTPEVWVRIYNQRNNTYSDPINYTSFSGIYAKIFLYVDGTYASLVPLNSLNGNTYIESIRRGTVLYSYNNYDYNIHYTINEPNAVFGTLYYPNVGGTIPMAMGYGFHPLEYDYTSKISTPKNTVYNNPQDFLGIDPNGPGDSPWIVLTGTWQ